jgi:hypothetical protein
VRTGELDSKYGLPEDERLTVIKPDGQVAGELWAIVPQSDLIYAAFAEGVDVVAGGTIIRNVPAGTDEYLILDPGLRKGRSPGHSRWEIKVRHKSEMDYRHKAIFPDWHKPGGDTHITVQGNAGQVITGGTLEKPTFNNNFAPTPETVFADLRRALQVGIQEPEERELLLARVDEMEAATKTGSFLDKYNAFIQSAANHMTLIGPFIPALTEMLMKAAGG